MSEPDANPTVFPDANGFRFQLIHLIYVVTLMAAALATFGPGGVVPGILVGTFWAYVFTNRSRPQALVRATLCVLLNWCLLNCLLWLPASSAAREAARRMQCSNNLKQIGLALHNYHADYGSFPPAYLVDDQGQPMHSWRVLLLPYLEKQALYDQYDFGEPWNGPNNSRLTNQMPSVYRCPTAGTMATCTSYLAVVGPETAWLGSSALKLADLSDGTSYTALVIESDNQNILWLAPQDLEFNQALDLLDSDDAEASGSHRREDFFYQYFDGRNVLLADGSVRFVSQGVGRFVWSALLGRNDAVRWIDDDLGGPVPNTGRLRTGNCLRLGLFVGLMFFPLPWVWLNPHSGYGPPTPRAQDSSATVES